MSPLPTPRALSSGSPKRALTGTSPASWAEGTPSFSPHAGRRLRHTPSDRGTRTDQTWTSFGPPGPPTPGAGPVPGGTPSPAPGCATAASAAAGGTLTGRSPATAPPSFATGRAVPTPPDRRPRRDQTGPPCGPPGPPPPGAAAGPGGTPSPAPGGATAAPAAAGGTLPGRSPPTGAPSFGTGGAVPPGSTPALRSPG